MHRAMLGTRLHGKTQSDLKHYMICVVDSHKHTQRKVNPESYRSSYYVCGEIGAEFKAQKP